MIGYEKLLAGALLALLGWGASAIYENIKITMGENRSSIQALIEIHLEE